MHLKHTYSKYAVHIQQIYDKYKGEYHTHEDGTICAGPHDKGIIVPNRILKIENTLTKGMMIKLIIQVMIIVP